MGSIRFMNQYALLDVHEYIVNNFRRQVQDIADNAPLDFVSDAFTGDNLHGLPRRIQSGFKSNKHGQA